MPILGSYAFVETIKKNDQRTIYRVRDTAGLPVVLKLLHHVGYTHSDGVKIRREYQMGKLFNTPHILKVLEQGTIEGAPYITYEDFDGVSLKSRITHKAMELKLFYEIANKMVLALMACHAKGIIHRDVNPSNFIVSQDYSVVKLADFGIADYLGNFQSITQSTPPLLQGTVEYIAPEQTGRLSVAVDFRTDIYSLGVTFYEMLTGYLPFSQEDSDLYGLIHRHLSEIPQPVTRLNPMIPKTLSDLVAKMLNKNPEQRYQSIFGVREDLMRLKLMMERERYQYFEVGLRDVSPVFKPSKELFSRVEFFETMAPSGWSYRSEKSRYILLRGERSSGKSFMLKAVADHYNQLGVEVFLMYGRATQQSKPYAALEATLETWVSKQQLAQAQDRQQVIDTLVKRIGPSLGILARTFPAIETLVGTVPVVESMNPLENRTRFNQGMVELFGVLQGDAGALLICIDDLHLLDEATLKVLAYIFSTQPQGVDFIASIDAKVVHYGVMELLESVPVTQYPLDPFSMEDIEAFLRSGFQFDLGTSQALTEILHQRTHGNPGELIAIVKRAVDDRILEFDYLTGRWHFDAARQEAIGVAPHVLRAQTEAFDKLSANQKMSLELLALMEGPVALSRLWHSEELPLFEFIEDMSNLVTSGFIKCSHRLVDLLIGKLTDLNIAEVRIWFSHEDFRAFLLQSMSRVDIRKRHLLVGLKLYEQSQEHPSKMEDGAELRHHLNACSMEDLSDVVRLHLAGLNLRAAQVARGSVAYATALQEAERAKYAFPQSMASTHATLYHDILRLCAEMKYLNHSFTASDLEFEQLLMKVEQPVEIVRINLLRLQLYINQGETEKVVALAKDTLRHLDFNLSEENAIPSAMLHLARLQTSPLISQPSRMLQMPLGEDEKAILTLEVLNLLISVSYLLSKVLFIRIILAMIELSQKYGMMRLTPFAFATYGIVEIGLFKRFKRAAAIAETSLEAARRSGDREAMSKVNFTIGFFINHWVKHIREALPYLEEGREQSRLSGNMVYFAYNSAGVMLARVAMSDNLQDIYDAAVKDLSHPDVQTDKDVSNLLVAVREYASAHLKREDGEVFDALHFERELRSSNMPSILAHHLILKMKRFYVLGDYSMVLSLSEELHPLLGELMGLYISVEATYYTALAFLKKRHIKTNLLLEGRLSHLNFPKLKRELKRLKRVSPVNFAHKYEHVLAVEHWVQGRTVPAHTAFHEAIRKAHEQSFLLEEGLMCEDLATFYLESGQSRLSDVFLRESYVLFRQIHSFLKCQQLKARFTHLAFDQLERAIFEPKATRTLISQSHYDYELQLLTKASASLVAEEGEISLYASFLRLLMEVTGAQKGVLALQHENLEVVAQMSHGEFWPLEPHEPIQQSKRLPVLFIQYASRLKFPSVLQNAFEDYSFNRDPYVRLHRVRSALCVPIWLSEQLIGTVYLENNLLKDAFKLVNSDLMQILARQFAMANENLTLGRSLSQSKQALIRHEENLGELVRERTYELSKTKQEIEILLNEVGQGFLSINTHGMINAQFSGECIKIFGHDIANEPFHKLMESHVAKVDGRLIREIIDKVFACKLDYQADLYLSLLPAEVVINGRTITIKYQLVNRSHLRQITVTMLDITEKMQLEQEFQVERQQLRMVLNAVRYQNNVRQSIQAFYQFCETEASVLLRAAEPRERLMTLFRMVHTFKGDFAQWSMRHATSVLHRLENELAELFQQYRHAEGDALTPLADTLVLWVRRLNAKEVLTEDLQWIEKYLGEDFVTREAEIIITPGAIQEIEAQLEAQIPEQYHPLVQHALQSLCWVSAETVVHQYSQYVQFLAESMGKNVAPVELHGDSVRFEEARFNPFLKSLIHIFRNSVQYGIENPDEREALGKSREGHIAVHMTLEGQHLTMTITDDGQGIDLDQIIEKARLIHPDVERWPAERQLQAIFDFGVSSSTSVDEVSGRGVGLSALRSAVHRLGGEVRVVSEPGAFTRFVMTFEV